MAERAKLWVYLVFGAFFTVLYSVVSHWIWHSGGWLFSLGMQDFAGSTVVHYQGALAALAGALLLGPRIGKFGHDGRANPIPGHNMPYAVLGTLILWFGWFGFNPGSTLGVVTGDKIGYFAYVALTTNLAAAAGALGGIGAAWLVLRKPDVSMMLNGVIAALVAITAASGFVAPWAAVVIGAVAGSIAVVGVLWVERIGIDDPIGAVAVHGMAGVWGTLAVGLFAVPALASNLATGSGGLFYTGSFHQLGVQALGLATVGVFTFSLSFGALWTLKRLWGIRVEEHVETAGLDVAEHGMWGYPEFYIPVPGGYGTESHSHLLGHVAPARADAEPVAAGTGRISFRFANGMHTIGRRFGVVKLVVAALVSFAALSAIGRGRSTSPRHAAPGISTPSGRRMVRASRSSVSDPSGLSAFFTMASGGGDERRLVSLGGDYASWRERPPLLSPDWTKVALISPSSALKLENVAGAQVAEIGKYVFSFAWSPDGRRVAFHETDLGGNSTIFVVAGDGSGLRSLGSGQWPAWSPAGDRIAFVAPDGRLYVMNADGSGRRLVYDGNGAVVYAPSWSPLGDRIAFFAASRLLVVSSEGTRIYDTSATDYTAKPPKWSFDGSLIAFEGPTTFSVVRLGSLDLWSFRDRFDPSWSPAADELAASFDGPCEPSGIYRLSVPSTSRRLTLDCHIRGTAGPDVLSGTP